MKEITYEITDNLGIHARPAGLLVKKAESFSADMKMYKGEKEANLKKLFSVMSLGVKCGDTVKVTAEGADEAEAVLELEKYLKENL